LKELETIVLKEKLPKKHTSNDKAYYNSVKNLGRGAAGSVELVRRSTDNGLFAMKVIPMHFMNDQEKRNAENEVHLLKVLVGPTIIRYYESFTESDCINIIMEYAEGSFSKNIAIG
jgi:NIMA (never in mitosis gene a)-related kinase